MLDSVKKHEALVKWFSPHRGFGFVKIPDISEDVFLHFSALSQIGRDYLEEGDCFLCTVARGDRGWSVKDIEGITHTVSGNEGRLLEVETVYGEVKWFNPMKSFGFAEADDGREDVFLHASLLKRVGCGALIPGQRLLMHVFTTRRGREAKEITLIDD